MRNKGIKTCKLKLELCEDFYVTHILCELVKTRVRPVKYSIKLTPGVKQISSIMRT